MWVIDWSKVSEILLTGLTSAIFTGILAFVAQKYIELWLSKTLEKFKVGLQLSAFEHQTRFTKLHEKRAEVIAEFYRRLVETEQLLLFPNFLLENHDKPPDRELIQKEFEKIGELTRYFEKNRIYFPENLCTKIEQLKVPLASVGLRNVATIVNETDLISRWKTVSKRISDEILPIKQELESEFRNMLGV